MTVAGDLDESPTQSPKLEALRQIKPHYRQRKVRKTGLSTVELQKALPELSDLVSAKQSALAAYVVAVVVEVVTVIVVVVHCVSKKTRPLLRFEITPTNCA